MTVTPNPSIDATVHIPVLRRGEVVRATATRKEAGGKGINVAHAAAMAGYDATAVAPCQMLGGATAGAVSMALGVGAQAPHGGVFVIFAYDPWWGMLAALAAGVAVAAVAVVALKQFSPNHEIRKAAEQAQTPVSATA